MSNLNLLSWVLAAGVFWIAIQPNPWRRWEAIREVQAGLSIGFLVFALLLALPGLATRW